MFLWITGLFIIALLVLVYYYFRISRRTESETDEHFMGAPLKEADTTGFASQFVAVGLPAEVVEDKSNAPAGGNDAVYFKETVSAKDLENALKLAMTAQMQDKWGDMKELPPKVVQTPAIIKEISTLIQDAVNVVVSPKTDRFEVRGAQAMRAASPNGDTHPYYYSKWDIMIHRGNKQYGYAFEATFIHIDTLSVNLCAVENIVAVTEDAVETITALPG